MAYTETHITARLQPLLLKNGAKLIDAVIRRARNRTIIEIFIDNEEGVTAEKLTAISKAVDAVINAEQWFTGAYTLNVSSPGLDRPIRFHWQYLRHKNRSVELVQHTDSGPKKLTGTIHDVDEQQLIVQIGEEYLSLPHSEIVEARIIAKL